MRNPQNDLMYDFATLLHKKGKAIKSLEKYVKDAQQAGSKECEDLFRKVSEDEARSLQTIEQHFIEMVRSGRMNADQSQTQPNQSAQQQTTYAQH